ncbi:copper resistance protein B [Acetobacter estunensis]|uniref:Copper resistance protein B n=1 Tax=Acetobacter estunensis TaxID=104097 RepID=A0A967B6Z2_9PROT|nr:copper resistance protein B [Acetobacter estunensis]NHO54329.1 copper resistance protein B [Acetobacter estunensis]
MRYPIGVAVVLLQGVVAAHAQHVSTVSTVPVTSVRYVNGIMPTMDRRLYLHAILEQFEARYSGRGGEFRYDGQAWYGTDYDKLWIKSEGTVSTRGQFGGGDHEALYDRAISRYFDFQTGVRLDIDHGPTRAWGAVGVQGLALYFFELSATAYFSDRGAAGRIEGSYDIFLTNRLILQPQVELNLYSNADRARGVGRGASDIDAGLRLRYEWYRKLAPYIAVTYAGTFGQAADMARRDQQVVHDLNVTFGVRTWF